MWPEVEPGVVLGGNATWPYVITPSRISTPNLSNTPSQPSVQPSEEEEEEEVGLAKGWLGELMLGVDNRYDTGVTNRPQVGKPLVGTRGETQHPTGR